MEAANPWESSTEYTVDVGAAEKCQKLIQSLHKGPVYPGVISRCYRVVVARTPQQLVRPDREV